MIIPIRRNLLFLLTTALPRGFTALVTTSSISTSAAPSRRAASVTTAGFPAGIERNLSHHSRHRYRRHYLSSWNTALHMSNPNNNNHNNDMKQLTIHWFRQTDLRLHDNPALHRAVQRSKSSPGSGILPVFVFDTTRIYGSDTTSSLGCKKCGPRRAQFVIEAVNDLRANLEKRGSGLVVGVGRPEDVLTTIASAAAAAAAGTNDGNANGANGGGVDVRVICQEEVCSEELATEKAVRSSLSRSMGKGSTFKMETVWGSTLYDPDTLPFDSGVFGIPDTFTPFRNKVEKSCEIGTPLDVPADGELALPKDAVDESSLLGKFLAGNNGNDGRCSLSYLPTLADLGYTREDIDSVATVDPRSAMPENYKGGETFALARVKDYIWDKDLLKVYFDTRNGMIGSDYSTKVR
ncbi:hypothetical protein ACHAXS_001790 [Conticribra weissflogii]